MAKQDVKKVYGNTLAELMRENPSVVAVDIDLMRIAGTDHIKEEFPDRYVNTGIAEQNGVGMAAGYASMGKTVFVSAFCEFLATRASDQCLDTVCYNELDVKLLGTYAGVTTGINGGTHISVNDIAAFRSMPGMSIVDVSDGNEMAAAIKVAAATPGPVYIRVAKGPLPDLWEADYDFQWGKGRVAAEIPADYTGKKIAVITTGITSAAGVGATAQLAEQGIPVTHIHMGSIKPIDRDLIIKTAQTHDVLITVDNHSVIGALGTAVCEVVCDEAPVKVVRLGIQDEFCEGMTEAELTARHGIDAAGIVKAVQACL